MKLTTIIGAIIIATATHLLAAIVGVRLHVVDTEAAILFRAQMPCPEPGLVFSRTVDLTTGKLTCRYYAERSAR